MGLLWVVVGLLIGVGSAGLLFQIVLPGGHQLTAPVLTLSRKTWILLVLAALLTLEIAIFERSPPPWTGAGKVFPGP